MPRPERRLDPDADVVQKFAWELRRLRQKAGSPAYRQLARVAHYSSGTLAEAAGGRKLPSLAVTLAYVRACGGDEQQWEAQWREIAHRSDNGSADDSAASAPYAGLVAFQPSDADRFFGREKLISDLRDLVGQHRLVGVFGASGAGKSSLLRAGLVGRNNGPAAVFTPGIDPAEECAVHLAAATGGSAASWRADLAADPANLHVRIRQAMTGNQGDLLVVIDQFEEVLTLCPEPNRAWLVEAILLATRAATSRVRIVLGIRADFYGHPGLTAELVDALRGAHILVGPMTAKELREAVTAPALRDGYRVEAELVTRVVADAAGQPGVLPLVSHALLETWLRRHGVTLTLAGYEAAGGIQHAVARTAEEIYGALEPGQQQVAEHLFLRLVAIGEGTEDTKRRVAAGELDGDPDTLAVVERLAAARLIVVGQSGVEMAHEALIRHWSRLAEWLARNREGLRIHRHLIEASRGWQALDRDPGSLYRGIRLTLAREWAGTAPDMLTAHEREFLDASTAAEAREHQVTRRHNRQLRWLAAGLAVLLLMAVAAGAVANHQRNDAVLKGEILVSRKLASEAGVHAVSDVGKAARLSLEAFRAHPTEEARSSLLSLASYPSYHGQIRAGNRVEDILFEPGGRLVVQDDDTHRAALWDARTVEKLGALPLPGDANPTLSRLTFSPGSKIVYGTSRDPVGNKLVAWDISQETLRLWENNSHVNDLAVSHDGSTLATAHEHAITLWDTRRAKAVATLHGQRGHIREVAFGSGSRVLVSLGDESIVLWDLSTRTAIRKIPIPHRSVSDVALAPDGRILATAGADGTIGLWEAASGRQQANLARHTGPVTAVAFDPGGQTLVSAGDNSVMLWDVALRERLTELLVGEPGGLSKLAISADGNTIAAAGRRSVVLWDRQRLRLLAGNRDERIAVSSDGDTVTSANPDRTPEKIYSPDGRRQAVFTSDGLITISDASDRRRVAELRPPHPAVPVAAAFSPDGQQLAVVYFPKVAVSSIVIWDLARQEPVRLAEFADGDDWRLRFSPDNKRLVALSRARAVAWDIGSRTPVFRIDRDNESSVNTFGDTTVDGRLLAVPQVDGLVTLWDAVSGQRPAELTGHTGQVNVVSFSHDGRLLATAGDDKTVIVWDAATRTRWVTLTGHRQPVRSLAWSPDNRTLASASDDRSAIVWTTDTAKAVSRLCGSLARFPAPSQATPPACPPP